MKVKELIEHLKAFDPEMKVIVYADHGQTYIQANCPTEGTIEATEMDAYYHELIHEYDIDESVEYVKVCVISD